MRRLILFRHAKTEARSASGDDASRRLVERGRAEAATMGAVLARAGFAPDLVLLSPAIRARETWEEASAAIPKARVEIRTGLYDATPEEVAAEIHADTAEADTVMVVGHNPSLQELAVELLIDGNGSHHDIERLSAGFPTSAAAVFELDEAGRCRLEALLLARDQRDQARGVSRIYKIVERAAWEAALAAGRLRSAGIDLADGFIHFSTAGQARETARLHFRGREGLVTLEVEADNLGEALRWEASRGGDLFPHLYAPLDSKSVIAVRDAPLGADGIPDLGDLPA